MPEYEGYWDCKCYWEAAKWTRLWLAWLMCNWESWDMQLVPINRFLCRIVLCRLKARRCRHGLSKIHHIRTLNHWKAQLSIWSAAKLQMEVVVQELSQLWHIKLMQVQTSSDFIIYCKILKEKYSTENQRTAYSLKTTLSLKTLLVCVCFSKQCCHLLCPLVRVRVEPFFTVDKYKQRDWWWSA